MSWLARSIANSLNLPDPHPADDDDAAASFNPNSIPESPRGVKEDLSDLKNTLSRQLWGVASFLAPPPPSLPDDGSAVRGDDEEGGGEGDAVVFEGIRSDFAEIEGRLRSGISRISSNEAVWKFTKMASSLFQVGEGKEEGEGVVGVSEEAVVFARNVAMHPETWLDFPIVDGDEDDDFELSDTQYEHAVAIEKQAPGLAALRMELCPGYMTEGNFWKIYFVLLHPRLKKEDAVLLSTPQIMELRAMLMQELQSRNSGKQKSDLSEGGAVLESGKSSHQELLSAPPSSGLVSEINESSISGTANSNFGPVAETEKHPVQASEIHVSRKPVDGEKQIDVDQVKYQRLYPDPSSQVVEDKYEDDGDDWLKEDTSDIAKVKGTTAINIENDEDVSFSDLEDDDGDIPATYKVTYGSNYLTRDSQDWVQLGGIPDDSAKAVNAGGGKGAKTEQATDNNVDTKDSNDWLDFDEVDEV